jgi:hypothetical protein
MPSTSKKQHNFMEAVAHNAAFAKKAGVPQSVGRDFSTADKGKKFAKGGHMATKKMGMGGDTTGMGANKQSKGMTKESMGKVRTAAPSRDGLAERGRTKGRVVKMAGNDVGTGSKFMTGGKKK